MNSTYCIPIVIACAIYIARMVELNKKRALIRGAITENLTLKLFMLVGSVMLVGSICEYVWINRFRALWPAVAAGVVIAVCSFWLRWQAIAALGKFWSLHVEIRENHEFVRTGPFRWVRHPAYFSMVLELLSIGFILNAWLMLLIIPFLFVPALLMRLRIEEQALVGKFGDAYREYQKITPALFPTRWPASK